ncbi:NACHT domain-containing protein [Aeromonas veronii]|uniref:NACHT domain-containing protein n=1 Tax=Aeromonas veronii TaxID=654 RepID=UPI002443F165|nr:NACHT domain-containing protein [Aeromonas veronii]
MADPNTGEINYQGEYIQLDLFPVNNDESISLQSIIDGLETGDSYVLLGDYGAGKSMTLREIYFKLRAKYRIGETAKFPIYINLREHSGQDDPSELLERHGRKIGFERPSSLIAAWRAGFAILLIDGFDEITSLGISSIKTKLREARRRSLEAVRKMLEQTPSSVGYIVSGREHFF